MPDDRLPTAPPTPDTPPWFSYGEQDENGIDLSLIRSNLRLTPLERVRLGDMARRRALELMEYGRIHRERIIARKVPRAAD